LSKEGLFAKQIVNLQREKPNFEFQPKIDVIAFK
jgi:hypothetical protein